ncbi:MAG: hypothetical protein PHF37_04145, partial [Phycisphaerae bacterium]|nr:hypothetical protein [Phycisphaerae bacterium]
CNEIIVSLSQAKAIYYKFVDTLLCQNLIDPYNVTGKQIYRLSKSWSKFRGKHANGGAKV